MDLGDLNLRAVTSQGATMDLLHPGTGEKTGVTFNVVGYDSEAVENAARDVRREFMGARVKADAMDVATRRRVAMACAALVGVEGGSGSTKTLDDFKRLMADPGYIWVIEQIEGFAGDRASFFKTAGKP